MVTTTDVVRRFIAASPNDYPVWSDVVDDLGKFNDFYRLAQKTFQGNQDPGKDAREELEPGLFAGKLYPETTKAAGNWLELNFPKNYPRLLTIGKEVRKALQSAILDGDRGSISGFMMMLEAYFDILNDEFINKRVPDRFTYQGFKVLNQQGLAEPLVRMMLDGVDFLVALFKKRGMEKALSEAVQKIELLYKDPYGNAAGWYFANKKTIAIIGSQMHKGAGKLWKNWIQEVFIHEFGHHVHHELPPDAWKAWEEAWASVEEAREKFEVEKIRITGGDRLRFYELLEKNNWNPAITARKLKPIDKLKFGTWLREPWLGEPLITPKQFRFTPRGKNMFEALADPLEYTRKRNAPAPHGDEEAYEKTLMDEAESRTRRYKEVLGVDDKSLGTNQLVSKGVAEQLRAEAKSIDEALDKLEMPTGYARTNPMEDFAETFVAFMVAPERLSNQAQFRMQRALSLAGLYGKPIMRIATRYQDSSGSYLDVGDIVLYGKFKNAKGKILSFGKNEKGDPTIEVQPVDADLKPKKGQPKTLTLLKVRKLTKESAMELTRRVVARFIDHIARGLDLGKTWENGKVRVHRYSNSFHVWDLTNAGKRGKKVRKMIILQKGYQTNEAEWLEAQSKHLILNAGRGYDSIKRYFEDLGDEATIEERQERGVDVLPGGTRTIKVQWKDGDDLLDLEATPKDFHLRHSAPLTHHTTGEPIGRQDTLYWPAKKTDAKRFYAWLSGEGEGKLKQMSIGDLRKLWREIDVQYDFH
jgi:hypothetical protein